MDIRGRIVITSGEFIVSLSVALASATSQITDAQMPNAAPCFFQTKMGR